MATNDPERFAAEVARFEVMLWGDPKADAPHGIKYWLAKDSKPGYKPADEPVVVEVQ